MFGVDVGGTFTDVVAIKDGRIQVTKVPSVPSNPQESVLEGARRCGAPLLASREGEHHAIRAQAGSHHLDHARLDA